MHFLFFKKIYLITYMSRYSKKNKNYLENGNEEDKANFPG